VRAISLILLKINLLILLGLVFVTPTLAAIGNIVDQDGPDAELKRQEENLVAKKGTSLEMSDVLTTTKTKLNLKFADDTHVAMTEQSKLTIDEFVYDPSAKKGSLAINVASGTVRYASGKIAKNNRRNVRLKTPTATISVRGTDFSMTVDEIGRSMVVLLPSCDDFGLIENKDDENNCPVGEIMVSTDAGHVIMNQAYQATVVASAYQTPTKPRVLEDKPLLNNLLIIAPPEQFPEGFNDEDEEEITQVTFLDQDLLEFDDLIQDLLNDGVDDLNDTSELDRNYLDGDFLINLLDLAVDPGLGDALKEFDGVLPTIGEHPWVNYYYNDQVINLYSEQPPHVAEIQTERDTNATVIINQNDIRAYIIENGGDDVQINIIQSQ